MLMAGGVMGSVAVCGAGIAWRVAMAAVGIRMLGRIGMRMAMKMGHLPTLRADRRMFDRDVDGQEQERKDGAPGDGFH